jgi:hypothetical protein
MEVLSDNWLVPKFRCAVSELMLVLIVAAMVELLQACKHRSALVEALPPGRHVGNDVSIVEAGFVAHFLDKRPKNPATCRLGIKVF